MRKSACGSVPDFAGMYPSVTSDWNHVAQATASGPFSTPSADLKSLRLIRSPPKLCSNGEKAYGHHSPVPPVCMSNGYW